MPQGTSRFHFFFSTPPPPPPIAVPFCMCPTPDNDDQHLRENYHGRCCVPLSGTQPTACIAMMVVEVNSFYNKLAKKLSKFRQKLLNETEVVLNLTSPRLSQWHAMCFMLRKHLLWKIKIIAVFFQGSIAGKDFLEESAVHGEHLPKPPFCCKPPCLANPRNLLRIFPRSCRGFFVLWFLGKQRPLNLYCKSPPFSNAKSAGKFEETIHKSCQDSRQSNYRERGNRALVIVL